MKQHREYYDVLGVKPDATQDEIKKAFRAKAKECHPDHHPGDKEKEAAFKRLSTAYSVLGDPELRRRYDLTGESPEIDNMLGESYSLIILTFRQLKDAAGDDIFFIDPIASMKDALSHGQSEAERHVRGLEKKNERNDKLIGKLSHKTGGRTSFLHSALAEENRKNELEIDKVKHQVEVIKKAQTILDEYSFTVEKRKTNVTDRRSGFGLDFDFDPGEFARMGFTWRSPF